MLKKVVIIALVAQTLSIQASDSIPALTWRQKIKPSYWLFGLNPNHPIAAQCVGGLATENLLGTSAHLDSSVDKLLDAEKVGKASYAAGHEFTYGAATGIPDAIKDGITNHPYVAGGLAIGALAWYLIPSQADTTRKAMLKQEEELHKSAQKQHQVTTHKAKQEMEELESNDALRACLNTHFGRRKNREQRVPSPCNSPARKAASYNAAKAASIIDGYYKYA